MRRETFIMQQKQTNQPEEEIGNRLVEIAEAIEGLCLGTSEMAVIEAACTAFLENWDDSVRNNKEFVPAPIESLLREAFSFEED